LKGEEQEKWGEGELVEGRRGMSRAGVTQEEEGTCALTIESNVRRLNFTSIGKLNTRVITQALGYNPMQFIHCR